MPSIVTGRAELSKTFQVKVRDPGLRAPCGHSSGPLISDVHAVRDVTFRIEPGEIVSVPGTRTAQERPRRSRTHHGLLYRPAGGWRSRVRALDRRTPVQAAQSRSGARQTGSSSCGITPPEETFLLNRAIYDIPEADYDERWPSS